MDFGWVDVEFFGLDGGYLEVCHERGGKWVFFRLREEVEWLVEYPQCHFSEGGWNAEVDQLV